MSKLRNVKLFVFDLGGTLMEYKGMHLSWSGYYKGALENINNFYSLGLSENQIETSVEIFTKYNPRNNPREKEIEPEVIFEDVIKGWNTNLPVKKNIQAFFDSLNLEPVIYDDSIPALSQLKKAGYKIAAMTDVATGMPDALHKNYVTPLLPYFDLYVSSLSCGYKKPNPKGLQEISENLGIAPENMVMTGDTSRDIQAAKNIGCRSILMNRSGKKPQQLNQDFTVTNALEILQLLKA